MPCDAWIEFCVRHPFLLYPVIVFQNELRAVTSLHHGVKYWEDQTRYRHDICEDIYLPFDQFLRELVNGTLDPRFEKRKLRNKSNTILTKPSQGHHFSNRRAHSFEDLDDGETATALSVRKKGGGKGAASTPSSTSSSERKAKKKSPTEPSSPASSVTSEVGGGGFFSLRSLLPFRSSTAPGNPSARVAVTVTASADTADIKMPTLPPLARLPSEMLKEQRKQDLIDRKSTRRKVLKAG
jgi:hypothetical protein